VLRWGCLLFGTSPVYGLPSSPSAKVKVEQKPSDEVMRSVRPSLALRISLALLRKRYEYAYQERSVKVAQCRLLTTQSGVCC